MDDQTLTVVSNFNLSRPAGSLRPAAVWERRAGSAALATIEQAVMWLAGHTQVQLHQEADASTADASRTKRIYIDNQSNS
ncbi:hypothetical protein EYF80_066149 [Liparis tanakae]|uniref:Uncharacterized protein n=1 Tax=Liparis tanakae TaxID=230148 RepID=A0A4Z2E4P8_9TELE|nr:hypothetical protein EYF80_066149 [Liparis tanakae]